MLRQRKNITECSFEKKENLYFNSENILNQQKDKQVDQRMSINKVKNENARKEEETMKPFFDKINDTTELSSLERSTNNFRNKNLVKIDVCIPLFDFLKLILKNFFN